MKTFLIASAAAAGLLVAGPAVAKPKHAGKPQHSQKYERDRDRDRDGYRERLGYRTGDRYRDWDDRRAAYYGDGRGYWNDGNYYRDGRYYGSNCPPGLAKKNNGCLPPGQAKARWQVGQRLPTAYQNYYIPQQYRDRYTDGTYRYYDGYVYRVDPQSYVIQQVIGALLR
ncbi:hypothetical protein [Tsuneonella amylolytica]|uniref:hypothetical protein n=1 Tax=Tsuneonella amylolytica TaxID=2338327 RepID=UPI000EAA4451|nr:hypothetical protein [Tsuneonella amylolytica]